MSIENVSSYSASIEANPNSDGQQLKQVTGDEDEGHPGGICVIPMPNCEQFGNSDDKIGNGRTNCCCVDRGSFRCVRKHVGEARDKLERFLGPETFSELGFFDMGEHVAEKWTDEEEKIFHEIFFSNPASIGKNFWNFLSAAFPSRMNGDIVSYYFNVFMLWKRAEQNRCDPMNIDSDNDEWHANEEEDDSVVESPVHGVDPADTDHVSEYDEDEDDDDDVADEPCDSLYGHRYWRESNGSPDREDNHLSSENGGRLGNSRSNDVDDFLDPFLPIGTDLSLCPFSTPYCSEPERNGSPDREDKHLSSKNEGRLHYSTSNDDLWMKLNNLPGGGTWSRIGKLLVSETGIANGSNGTIVFEGFYELRPVAVKRLVKGHHDRDDCVFNEIKNLTKSDLHPNIVRYYGAEYDQNFVYLALERCACNLCDLIQALSESSYNSVFPNDPASTVGYKSKLDSVKDAMPDVKLWRPDGHPSPFLLKLMRDVVSGLAYLHLKGIIHRDLKPQNVLITKNPSLGAKLCDMGISRCLPQDKSSLGNHATGCGTSGWQAPEQLCRGRQTRAMDMFSLGCVLFFCITGGRHPFGECLERDINIKNNKMDLSLVESIPEAHDLISLLLNPDLELRPKPSEVLRHPFFWSSETRLYFLRNASERVQEDVVRATKSDLLNKLESKAPLLFAGNWHSKIEPIFMDEIRGGRHRPYDYSRVSDLLRAVRNKLSHYRELPEKVKELVGPVPEGFDNYFAERFPRLLMSSYEVVSQFCEKEECFREYFGSVDAV